VNRWSALAPRERTAVFAAGTLVALALIWWAALAPALGVLRTADEQHRVLDAQLRQVRSLQAAAQALRAQPKLGNSEAQRALELSVREQFGVAARLSIAGDRATVTLSGAPAGALSRWLGQARVNARLLPAEARLARNAAGNWDGTVVLMLPPR
jgi:general secretion pathway protein M